MCFCEESNYSYTRFKYNRHRSIDGFENRFISTSSVIAHDFYFKRAITTTRTTKAKAYYLLSLALSLYARYVVVVVVVADPLSLLVRSRLALIIMNYSRITNHHHGKKLSPLRRFQTSPVGNSISPFAFSFAVTFSPLPSFLSKSIKISSSLLLILVFNSQYRIDFPG